MKTMQPAICIRRENRKEADEYFLNLRKMHDRLQGAGAIFATLMRWLVSLVVLFILLAYRPSFDPLKVFPIKFEALPTASEGGKPPMMSNSSPFIAFRDYLARVVGAIPPNCAIIESAVPIPGTEQPPLLAIPLTTGKSCEWRNSAWSIVVALSPDVSPVQKVTLLALLLGWTWLRRQAIERKIDLISFPRNDRELDVHFTAQDTGWAEHPASRIDNPHRLEAQPLYPRRLVVLDPITDTDSFASTVRKRLSEVSLLLGARKLSAPIDLIIDVLEAGATHGSVGAAAERMRVAIFEFKEKVVSRLWPVDYLLWLLPTIGFIGTIYGISMSLVSAKALFVSQSEFAEQIGPVVDGLGVAFDTTAMALVCAAILYLMLKRAEAGSTDLAAAAEESLSNLLISRLVDRPLPQAPAGGSVVASPAATEPTKANSVVTPPTATEPTEAGSRDGDAMVRENA